MPGLDKTFPLDGGSLGPTSAASLNLSGATDLDIVTAIAADTRFPSRPGGQIDLAHIGFAVHGDRPVAFHAGSVTLGVEFSAGITAAAGIFDDAAAAVAALSLGETPGLDLSIDARPGARYALLTAGYTAAGSVTGTHPIGALGTITFGVSGALSGVSAVIHRFSETDGARTVLEQTVRNWKLPRHVTEAANLLPGTWVIAEADGSLAVKIAAALGYNFSFVRDAMAAGLSGDIGLKLDAAATATFGIEVSGRYLVVVCRESEIPADERIRVRLFKLSSRGLQFGLNLKVGVTGVETVAPDQVDDFVKAVFGVHGDQVVGALRQIDAWTGPEKSVGDIVAGLTNDKALAILQDTTGVDPRVAFAAAQQRIVEAIDAYRGLGPRVSSELWAIIGKLGAPETAILKNSLTLLAGTGDAQKQAFLGIISETTFATSPIGRILDAAADRGLLNLLDRLPEVRKVAMTVLDVLDGGVISKLQAYVESRLHLQNVLDVATKTEFDALDAFLIGRLSAFFDKQLHFEDLNDIKNTIHTVLAKRQEVFAKIRKALNSRYGMDLAETWQRTTGATAVFDVEFDTSQPDGRALLTALVQRSGFDQILTATSPAVQIRAGVLTHEVTRKTTVDVTLPHFEFQGQNVNQAIARVSAEESGPGVLLYDATGTDVVNVRNKYRSSLAVGISAVAGSVDLSKRRDLRVHSTDGTWSYELLCAANAMGREELEALTRPFIDRYMSGQFTGDTTLSLWYRQMDDAVESRLHNGPEKFGDVCAAFEVTLPIETIAAWLKPVGDVTSAAKAVSQAIQRSLKEIVPFYFLTDVSRLHNLGRSAALLAWASIPPANSIRADGGRALADQVFWDPRDPAQRSAMLQNADTKANLGAALGPLRLRLEEAKRHSDVQFYQADQVNTLIATALSSGSFLLDNLLSFERAIATKAAAALADVQEFVGAAASSPSKAVVRLADFAADISMAFNTLAGETVFAGMSFRAVSQSVFVEAARALDPSLAARPRAMLTLTILEPARTFTVQDFLQGTLPAATDVLFAQRLVSA